MIDHKGSVRAVLISDVSPGKGHIYGLRVASIAVAMARRGHQIIVLSPTRGHDEGETTPESLARLLKLHDWDQPLFVERAVRSQSLLEAMRSGRFPGPVRQSLTAMTYATQGGVHGDWVAGARPLLGPLATHFSPDVVWANFGNASNLVVGQQLARLAGVPWFMDIKDNWDSYVPAGLRRIVAHRFRDAAGFTSNARLHADIAAQWNRQPHKVIYSSVAPQMIAPLDSAPRRDVFQLTLVGSTYQADQLARFVNALASWLQTLSPEERALVSFRYAGVSAQAVTAALASAPPDCHTQIDHNLSHADLAQMCHDAAVNCYLWFPQTYHHKLFELLACRRPVISFPGEHEESKSLVEKIGGQLDACGEEAALVAAFSKAFENWQMGETEIKGIDMKEFSWDRAAERLEGFFQKNRTAKIEFTGF